MLKDYLTIFKTGAEVNFKTYGYLVPVFAGVIDGEPMTFGLCFSDAKGKDEFAAKILEWIAQDRLKEYIMVVEAWTAILDDKGKVSEWFQKHGSLENWPDRGEIVSVLYCSPKEEIEYTANIERGTIAVLGPWRVSERSVLHDHRSLFARFQGLFVKGKAGQN